LADRLDWDFLLTKGNSMAETAVADKPVVDAAKPVDTKTADKPVVDAGKPAPVTKPAVDDKTAPVPEVKAETKAEVKPAEELKSLLDEAGEEVKLDKDGKPIAAEAKVIPDKYEFKLPEGVTLDEASLALVTPAFKELGLDNVQAQKLVDLQLSLTKANEETHVKAWEAFIESQKTEAKTYFGTKLPEVMRNVARARDTFISKPMQEKLNVAGFSNDKDFLETLDKIGRVIGEGKFVQGKQSAPAKGDGSVEIQGPTMAEVYPSMKKT
jgi:hypothetical protein